MTKPRRNRRADPACDRCGNEEDLLGWPTGDVFCQHCLRCPHSSEWYVNDICTECLRKLYTIWTFRGPRIRNLALYRIESWRDYGLRSFEILYWTFDEQELALQDAGREPLLRTAHVIKQPPPHHRFTSSRGSR